VQNYYQKQKKPWVRPGIRVFVRNQEHEAVLAACKHYEVGSGGPNGNWSCTFTGYGSSGNPCVNPQYS